MKREDVVDFFQVEPAHLKIDARLTNWAKWAHSPAWGRVQPMFRLYRSNENWNPGEASTPVDPLDAAKIQKGVAALPEKHRAAVQWSYILRNNPKRAARDLAVNLQGLADLIRAGRIMLINRRV